MPQADLDVIVDGEPCTYKFNSAGKISSVVVGPFYENGETVTLTLSPALNPPDVPGAITADIVFHKKEHLGMRDESAARAEAYDPATELEGDKPAPTEA